MNNFSKIGLDNLLFTVVSIGAYLVAIFYFDDSIFGFLLFALWGSWIILDPILGLKKPIFIFVGAIISIVAFLTVMEGIHIRDGLEKNLKTTATLAIEAGSRAENPVMASNENLIEILNAKGIDPSTVEVSIVLPTTDEYSEPLNIWIKQKFVPTFPFYIKAVDTKANVTLKGSAAIERTLARYPAKKNEKNPVISVAIGGMPFKDAIRLIADNVQIPVVFEDDFTKLKIEKTATYSNTNYTEILNELAGQYNFKWFEKNNVIFILKK